MSAHRIGGRGGRGAPGGLVNGLDRAGSRSRGVSIARGFDRAGARSDGCSILGLRPRGPSPWVWLWWVCSGFDRWFVGCASDGHGGGGRVGGARDGGGRGRGCGRVPLCGCFRPWILLGCGMCTLDAQVGLRARWTLGMLNCGRGCGRARWAACARDVLSTQAGATSCSWARGVYIACQNYSCIRLLY